jgi:hypothetical protein
MTLKAHPLLTTHRYSGSRSSAHFAEMLRLARVKFLPVGWSAWQAIASLELMSNIGHDVIKMREKCRFRSIKQLVHDIINSMSGIRRDHMSDVHLELEAAVRVVFRVVIIIFRNKARELIE